MRLPLFWKLFLPVTILFVLIITSVAVVTPELVKRNAEADALEAAQRTVNQLKSLRAYYVKNVIKKVIGRDGIKGSFEHENDPDAIPLPATMIHDLSKLYSAGGTSISLYSAFPYISEGDGDLTRRLPEDGEDEISHIATAINEMAAAAEEVSRHAAEAAQASAETDSSTQTTQSAVNAAVNDIQQFSSKLEAAASTMNQLQDGAQNVGGVIDVIRGIADQTVSNAEQSNSLSQELASIATELQTQVKRFKV